MNVHIGVLAVGALVPSPQPRRSKSVERCWAAMAQAHVIIEDGPGDTTVVALADLNGRFAFTLSRPGGYGMHATGIHHQMLEMPFIVAEEQPVELHVRLAADIFREPLDSFSVATADTGDADVLME